MKNTAENLTNMPLATGQKPVVHYSAVSGRITVGQSAKVRPLDHTSDFVSNTTFAVTSKVVRHDRATGEFETENSRYRPA
jgi:hypothetical protein